MDIFKNLENLNVSEECFNDIMDIVESIINEVSLGKLTDAARKSLPLRSDQMYVALRKGTEKDYEKANKRDDHARDLSRLGDLVDKKGGEALKYQANANDFIKKFNRTKRKMTEKGQKDFRYSNGTFPERKGLRTELQKYISAGKGSVHEITPKGAKEEKYEHYINPVKKHN